MEVIDSLEQLDAEWQLFLDRLPPGSTFRRVAEDSWKRCQLGRAHGEDGTVYRVADVELQRRMEANAELLDVAASHLEWISAALSVPHVLYITDRDGIILFSVGSDDVLADNARLLPGCDWSEARMGANSTGVALSSGKPVTLLGSESTPRAFGGCTCSAAPIRNAAGELIGALDLTTPNMSGAPGRLALVSYAARTIGAEIAARAAAAEQAQGEWLRLAMEAGNLGAWELDLQTGEVRWDARAQAIYGRRIDRPVSLDEAWLVIHEHDRPRTRQAMEAATDPDGNGIYDMQKRIVWPDGSIRWVSTRGRVLFRQDGGHRRAVRVLGIVTDITTDILARQRLEELAREAQQANRTKTEFLSAISHELRTPLAAIAGYVDIIDAGIYGPLTEAQRHALGRIKGNQVHLLTLINDILGFARLQAGKIVVAEERLPLDSLLQGVGEVVEPLAEARGIGYDRRSCDPSWEAFGDADRVRQILVNLIGNAIKFTEPGGRITLSCHLDGSCACIRVADTGPGIEAADLERIFEPFVQAPSGRDKGVGAGVGLGLAISRNLARAMGGDLTVESEPGNGSTFTIRLRAAPPVAATAPPRNGPT
jgi:PAS domain S-box-containing protein